MAALVVARGSKELLLFAVIDALRPADQAPGSSIAHFDEDDDVSVAHNEVDFPSATAVVLRQCQQPLTLQMFTRQAFGLSSNLPTLHYWAASTWSVTRGRPLTKRAHVS